MVKDCDTAMPLFGVARRRQRGNVFVCRQLGTAFALRL
jgi:hypothetical protein